MPLITVTSLSKLEEAVSHLLLTGVTPLVLRALTREHVFSCPFKADKLANDLWDTGWSHSEEFTIRFLWLIKGGCLDGTHVALYLFTSTQVAGFLGKKENV